MGKNNEQMLKLALAHLGQGGARFRKYCGMSSGAWCCAFVTYMFHEGNDSKLFYGGKKVVYCPNAIRWCDANLALIPPYLAMPMDIIFFDWNANDIPDHIGFVRKHKNCDAIYTVEGNTSGGIVAKRTRATKYVLGVYRPHYKADYKIGKLDVDGVMGNSTIANLQKALRVDVDGILGKQTVKKLQKKCGVTADGAWGKKTSKAIQKLIGVKQDGLFGEASVKALQKWVNKQNGYTTTKTTATKTTQDKVIAYADKLVKNGFKYVNYGKQKQCPICHKGLKYGSNCIGFAGICLRHGGGIKVDCDASGIMSDQFGDDLYKSSNKLKKWESRNGNKGNWKIIWNGGKKIPMSMLKKGDIGFCYHGDEYKHTVIYRGSGKITDCSSGQGGAKTRKYSSLGNPVKVAVRWIGK